MADQFDLFDLEFDEVSFVPGGDNPEAHIVLSKSYPPPPPPAHKNGSVSLDSWITEHSQTGHKPKGMRVVKIRQRGNNGQFYWTDPESQSLADWIDGNKSKG